MTTRLSYEPNFTYELPEATWIYEVDSRNGTVGFGELRAAARGIQ